MCSLQNEHEHAQAQAILHYRGGGEDGPSTHGMERLSARSSRHGQVKHSAISLSRLPPYGRPRTRTTFSGFVGGLSGVNIPR